MKNPADSRPQYFYTPAEVATAREIMTAPMYDRFGGLMVPDSWRKWAAKVVTWYGRFRQVLRAYARALHSLALAQVAIWQNIRAGLSVPRMLRDLTPDQLRQHGPQVWQSRPYTPAAVVQPINPKTNKHDRRAQCGRIAAHLQTATA